MSSSLRVGLIALFLSGVAVNGQATTLFDLTINYNTPVLESTNTTFGFGTFSCASYGWPTPGWSASQCTALTSTGATPISPGATTFSVSLATDDLSTVYFDGVGGYNTYPPPYRNIFVAEPPAGIVDDELAWAYGPPWISLAALNSGDVLSGQLWLINGYSNQPGGSSNMGSWEIKPVPEPSSMLLFGTGVAALLARRKKAGDTD